MKILALEFSSNRRGIALYDGQRTIEQVHTEGQVTPVFQLISTVLEEAQWTMKEIELVAVGLGPGSYTGIRLAIATAQGITLANNAQCAGVPSYLSLPDTLSPGISEVHFVIDAQQQEYYLTTFNGNFTQLRIVPKVEVLKLMETGATVAGPDIGLKLFPSASGIARRAIDFKGKAEELQPIYLRETKFVKAPPPRTI